MAELRTLARPYAKAAFSAAQEHEQLAEWSKVLTIAGQDFEGPPRCANGRAPRWW